MDPWGLSAQLQCRSQRELPLLMQSARRHHRYLPRGSKIRRPCLHRPFHPPRQSFDHRSPRSREGGCLKHKQMPISERMAVATASETAFTAIASETRRKLLDARPGPLPLILTPGWKGMLRKRLATVIGGVAIHSLRQKGDSHAYDDFGAVRRGVG